MPVSILSIIFNCKIMKKSISGFILTAIILGSGSCSRFDDFNTDPNQTTSITPELLATDVILGTVKYPSVGKDFLYKDMLAKYISYMEGATDYQYNKFDRAYFGSLIKLTNVEKMITLSKGSIYEDSYTALGKFIRAYTFYDLTMHVGDIPYSEAIQGENAVYNPKYDTQKDVFIGILNELDEADQLFSTGRNFPGDPVYDGDVSMWQKATNNLRLKVLSHLWKKTSDADLEVISRFDDIVTNKPLMTSSSDNFQLVYSSIEVEYYPFYNSSFRRYPIMSSTIVSKMREYNDYRLFYYAEPSEYQLLGGRLATDTAAYVGVDPSDDFNSISAKYAVGKISSINKRYFELPQGEPTFLLSYAEQCFIIAEGILRGWTAGDAQAYYENGVRSAMLFVADNTPDDVQYHHGRKITATVIDDYLAGTKVAFTGTTDEKLHKISQQRYFLGFMQDGWNSYYENRRVGYPAFPINELTNQNPVKSQMPLRWMYPSKELSYNRTQVEEAINRQFAGNDDFNELMWILQ
jgi:hypothetical protein